ncbi:MAG: AMP-binding protein [Burkholderiales bacterium]
MTGIALAGHEDAGATLAYRGSRAIRADEFLADVGRVAALLPARRHLVNLCTDRYCFTVGLAAAILRGQVSLLPPNQTPEMLGRLAREYDGLYALVDSATEPAVIESMRFPADPPPPPSGWDVPLVAADTVVAIAFTSGSTGHPTPHAKTWGGLARGALGEASRLGLLDGRPATLIATVPAQHMYGLESTVLLALRNGFALHAARPFYPADVRQALEEVSGERVLVTTPVHLRALLAEDVLLPELKLVVCATAPLPLDIAAEVEARYRVPLMEIYGFTEAGQVAVRRTLDGAQWRTLPDVRLRSEGEQVWVQGGPVEKAVPFTDIVEVLDEERFVLHGRSADLVNVAGKRSSLGYLNHQLNSIAGVDDGVFFMPEETASATTRLTAFVVAPRLDREQLLAALRERIDPAFLPRPLYFVDTLPRSATGKLPRDSLERLAAACARPERGVGA